MERISISLDLVNKILKFLGHCPFNQVSELVQAIIADVEGQKAEKAEEPIGEEKDV